MTLSSRHSNSRWVNRWIYCASLLACLAPLIYPADAPWINDEPQCIQLADTANHAHRLANSALVGTTGFIYPPGDIWIYQILRAVTSDLVALVRIHVMLMMFGMAAGLFWLARSLDLPRELVPAFLLSPYLWFYSRLLWTNTFAIPLSVIALAAAADFMRRGKPASFYIAWIALLFMPLMHPMGLAFSFPLAAFLLVIAAKQRTRLLAGLIALLVCAGAMTFPYLMVLLHAGRQEAHTGWRIGSFLAPLTGSRVLTAAGFEFFTGNEWLAGAGQGAAVLFDMLRAPSTVGILLCAIGVAIAIRNLSRPVDLEPRDIRKWISSVCLMMLLAQCAIDGAAHIDNSPHYSNSTWGALIVFAWLGADVLRRTRRRAFITAVAAYTASLAITLGVLIVALHRTGGTRSLGYGVTLGNQVEIAREITQYSPDSKILRQPLQLWLYPLAMDKIIADMDDGHRSTRPTATVQIRYATTHEWDGHVTLVRVNNAP
jgi:hypothetical protein